MGRVTNKVSKKVKLSKAKLNYRKHERRLISRYERRQGVAAVRQALKSGNDEQ